MAHKIPSYHDQGFALDPTFSSTTNQKTATEYVDEFLIQRRKVVEADPNLRTTDRLSVVLQMPFCFLIQLTLVYIYRMKIITFATKFIAAGLSVMNIT